MRRSKKVASGKPSRIWTHWRSVTKQNIWHRDRQHVRWETINSPARRCRSMSEPCQTPKPVPWEKSPSHHAGNCDVGRSFGAKGPMREPSQKAYRNGAQLAQGTPTEDSGVERVSGCWRCAGCLDHSVAASTVCLLRQHTEMHQAPLLWAPRSTRVAIETP